MECIWNVKREEYDLYREKWADHFKRKKYFAGFSWREAMKLTEAKEELKKLVDINTYLEKIRYSKYEEDGAEEYHKAINLIKSELNSYIHPLQIMIDKEEGRLAEYQTPFESFEIIKGLLKNMEQRIRNIEEKHGRTT